MSDTDNDDTTPLINPANQSAANSHGTFQPTAPPPEEADAGKYGYSSLMLVFSVSDIEIPISYTSRSITCSASTIQPIRSTGQCDAPKCRGHTRLCVILDSSSEV